MSDIQMRRTPDDEIPDPDQAGAFCWRTARNSSGEVGQQIVFSCPKGQGLCGVPIRPSALPNGASWAWDGNQDAPTLSPSINCVGGCGWHGFIQGGKIKGA